MSKLRNSFLQREVKGDKRGIFVHYGRYKLRPFEDTSFEESQLVSMTLVNEEDFKKTPAMKVFANLNKYEIWVSDSAGECFFIGDHIYTREIKK